MAWSGEMCAEPLFVYFSKLILMHLWDFVSALEQNPLEGYEIQNANVDTSRTTISDDYLSKAIEPATLSGNPTMRFVEGCELSSECFGR